MLIKVVILLYLFTLRFVKRLVVVKLPDYSSRYGRSLKIKNILSVIG